MRPAILLCVLTFGCDDAEPQDEPTRDVGIDAALDAAPPEPDASTPEPDMAGPEPDMSAPDPDGAPPEPDAAPGPLDAPCNTAAGELPEGLVELRWDDGTPVGDVAAQDWEIAGLALKDAEMHEAVRFELAHPARIHGFSVQFGTVPPRETWSVEVGLYPDFGANGFDFWQFDPLWEGSRCAGDITPGQWVTYAFDEPVEVPHPGLVYVGHRRGHLFDPAFLFDGTPPEGCESNDCCGPFDACHSAWNFPELTSFQGTPFFNGLSTTFLYDYMVRLHVEYTEEADPAEDLFQPIEGAPQPSNRMAWGDYDNDGDDDLLVNGPRLYRNDGGGAFTEVTEESGLVGDWHGAGTWGDYDNDGCLDFFLFDEAYNRSDHLFRGDCEGGFADVTEQSGIVDVQDYNLCDDPANDRSPSPAAAWIDVDADGLLDLYVANFICWSPGTYYADQIWHNEGDGTFTERTGLDGWAGLEDPRLASRGTSPIDIDQDGDVDLLVSTYRLHPNRFYVNQGDGAVAQQAEALGLRGRQSRLGVNDAFGHAIGTAWGDLDGDGDFDLVIGNLAHPRFFHFSSKSEVLLQQDDGTFEDIQGDFEYPAGEAGLRYQETHSVPVLADFDQDGHLDLAISATYDGRPSDFYWGAGDGHFELDQYRSGLDVENGWGMAVADIDHDGDLDLAASGVIYRNTRGDAGHWLQVRAVGNVASNRAALGATVRVVTEGRTFVRHVNGGTGQGCQDSLYLHFGLGDAATVRRIEVLYPGGGLVTYEGPFDADQRVWVYEDGTATPGWEGTP